MALIVYVNNNKDRYNENIAIVVSLYDDLDGSKGLVLDEVWH
jgi:hypothetical protein